jgi:hypothetical protein
MRVPRLRNQDAFDIVDICTGRCDRQADLFVYPFDALDVVSLARDFDLLLERVTGPFKLHP